MHSSLLPKLALSGTGFELFFVDAMGSPLSQARGVLLDKARMPSSPLG
jgi:hypothetical protein